MRKLICAAVLGLWTAAAGAADLPEPPRVPAGLTIPELVAELEKAGYSRIDGAESNERSIVLSAETPEGRAATVKYLKMTGTLVIVGDAPTDADSERDDGSEP